MGNNEARARFDSEAAALSILFRVLVQVARENLHYGLSHGFAENKIIPVL